MKLSELGKIQKITISVVGSIVLILALAFYYGYSQITKLSDQTKELSSKIESLEISFASTTVFLKENIDSTQTSFTDALEQEQQNVSNIKDKLGSFENTVGTISSTVGDLEKLSKTDPELLQKYSKVFFLNEHYSPPSLDLVPKEYRYYDSRNSQFHSGAWPYLKLMIDSALRNNIKIFVYSAFRSFDTQAAIKDGYTVTYGEGSANQFSADQGYSEHQLGTTLDIITPGIGGTLTGFDKTDAYVWLNANAHNYGFTLSYPAGNQYYIFEPWHWRFVGVKLATDLYNSGKHFYDLDQREIDKYLVNLFD